LGYMFHSDIRILGSGPYRPDEMGPLWATFCAGDFEAVIDSEFALADAAEAQAKMEASNFFGKILLKP
ncbi:MAG: zinc-binding dehydrogenase, partial [Acidimicrobiales bacterium]